MSFTPDCNGHCDCCYHPDANNVVRPLETTTYDAGGGDMRTQQLCADCTGRFEIERSALERGRVAAAMAEQIESLSAIADMHSTGGVDLPASFFKGDGSLRLPPWEYMGARVDILKNERDKTITIVVPVSCMRTMSNHEIVRLVELTEALGQAFARVVPEGWKVRT